MPQVLSPRKASIGTALKTKVAVVKETNSLPVSGITSDSGEAIRSVNDMINGILKMHFLIYQIRGYDD